MDETPLADTRLADGDKRSIGGLKSLTGSKADISRMILKSGSMEDEDSSETPPQQAKSLSRSTSFQLLEKILKRPSTDNLKQASQLKQSKGDLQRSTDNLTSRTSSLGDLTKNVLEGSKTKTSSKGSLASSNSDGEEQPSRFFNWPVVKSLSKSSSTNELSDSQEKLNESSLPVQQKFFTPLRTATVKAEQPLPSFLGLSISNKQTEPTLPQPLPQSEPPKMKLGLFKLKKQEQPPVPVTPPKVSSDEDEESEDPLPDLPLTIKSKIKAADVKELSTWLSTESPAIPLTNLLILDIRPFVAYNSEHIHRSFNMNIPPLMLQRFRRGSLQFLNLEKFICGEEGREKWRNKNEEKILVIDDIMPQSEREFHSAAYKTGVVALLFSSLEKEVEGGILKGDVYWLKGGYQMFKEYTLKTTKAMHWINTTLDLGAASEVKMGESYKAKGTNRISLLSISGKSVEDKKSTLMAVTELQPALVSPSMRDPMMNDASMVLPWLFLGSDPSVTTANKDKQYSKEDIFISLPSPVLPRKLATQTAAGGDSSASVGSILHLRATMEKIKVNNINYIINLANECANIKDHFDKRPESEFHGCLKGYKKIGIYDYEDEDVEKAIIESIDAINKFHAESPDSSIFVHCRAGRSRSATIVIAYLMKMNGWSLQKAYEFVKTKRPEISPNLGFMSALKKWEASLQ